MVEFLHDGHRRRVALVTNIPTPYRLVVYDLLSTEADIDLKLFYCSDREPNRDWDIAESSVPSHYLRENYITLANRVVHINLDIWPNLRSFKPEFVITSGFNPTHLVAMAYAWLNGAKLITMTDGTFRSEKELTLIHRLVRRLSFSRAHAFVGASESSFDMYKSYGIQPQRMFKSHLCANNPAFLSQHHAPKVVDFIFCGRLVGVKNPLFALDVARESARRLGRRVSIILVGSGQLEEAIRQQALVMHEDVDVHLPGFSTQAELPKYYAGARVFLFPTSWDPWGVVANEACAAGLPVIVTPEAGVAGELVVHNRNGFVIPLVLQSWVDSAVALLVDEALYMRMSAASRDAVADYTYINAAKGLAQAVRFAGGAVDQPFISALRPAVKQIKVVIVQRRLTHYRVPLFQDLRRRLETFGIALHLVYGDSSPAELSMNDSGFIDWAEHVPCHYFLHSQICWQNICEHTQDTDLLIVPHENKLLINHFLLLWKRPFKMAFWGHGTNLQSRNPSDFRGCIKRWTTNRVDWWFPYTELSSHLVFAAGFPSDRTTVLNNALDTMELCSQRQSITVADTVALRHSLNFGVGPVGVYLGTLHTFKRLDFLFASADAIHSRIPEFQMLILGDGPERDKVSAWCAERPWARWQGACFGLQKVACLSMAEVMLNPGLVGLSILDSFGCNTPLVTTDCGIHSPEIAYLENGVNGLMTSDNVNDYVDACVHLLTHPESLDALRKGCAVSAAEYSIDNMAHRFAQGVMRCLAAPAYHHGAGT